MFLRGEEGRGGVRAREAGGREGVVEREVDRAVTRDGPGDDVGAVVRARAGVLTEIKLERLNLYHRVWRKTGQRRDRGEEAVGGEMKRAE